MKKLEIYYLVGTITLIALTSCKKNNLPAPSPIAVIHSIIFRQADNHFLYGTDTVGQFRDSLHIEFTVPGGTDITHLIPTVNFTGARISPASGTAQDFTQPVEYIVTAANGTKRAYLLNVVLTYANAVFAGSNDGGIYCFDATTGKVRWKFVTNGAVQGSPFFITGVNALFMGSSDHNFYSLNPVTGAKIWATPTNGAITGSALYPQISSGAIYIASWDQNLYAINPFTGSVFWQSAVQGIISGTPLYSGRDDRLFVGTRSGELYNFFIDFPNDIVDSLQLGGSITGSIGLADIFIQGITFNGVSSRVIYYCIGDNNIYARVYNEGYAPNNEALWSFPTGASVVSSPVIANGVLYAGSNDNKIYALNDTTGKLIWSFATGGPVQAQVTKANGVLYAGSNDGKLYAINALTGAPIWSAPTGNAIEGACVVANGVVYVGSTDHNLYAFAASSGSLLWTSATMGSMVGTPTVIGADSTIYY